MHKFCGFLKFAFVVLLFALPGFSQGTKPFNINESPLPKPDLPIVDDAGVLSPEEKSEIAAKLVDFAETSNPRVELAVAIVKTTGDRDIFDYSLAVARGWGIGTQADDNPGALLFIAIDDRAYFTQVSTDLEDELPDGLIGSLQRQFLVPQFRSGDYAKGINDTIDAYIRTIKASRAGEPLTIDQTAKPRDNSSNGASVLGIGCCIMIVFLVIIVVLSSGSNNKGGKGGGGGSGSDILAIILASLLTSGSSGSDSDWSGGSGSSGGWGGFGGGGSFGGGGAGGSW
ncbi:MAG: TPM domain-containing protein [Pyrinomonadaceae bacterium]